MNQEFSVEQGYAIGLIFFLRLWTAIEPQVMQLGLDEDKLIVYDIFFRDICTGYEASAEWNQAVFRAKGIPKENQKILKLTNEELFLCAIEFAKLHNERWESNIDYAVNLLESMKKSPRDHQKEWAIWEKARDDFMSGRSTFYDLDWSAILP